MKTNTMSKHITRFGLALILLLLGAVSLSAYPTRPWNHRHNPVLLSTGNRPFFETGFSTSTGFQNSYMTGGRIFSPTIVIDFEDIYQSIGGGGYKVGANMGFESHTVAHLLGFGAGIYTDFDTLFQVAIPRGLFGFLSEGFEMDTTYSDSGRAVLRSFLDYGAYGSFRWEPYTFGVKLGKYIPLAYTRDGEATYSFKADEDGRIDAEVAVNAQLFSAFDLENMDTFDPTELISGPGGLKIDLGAVYNPTRNRPMWGVSFTNIPLYAPLAVFGWEYTASAGAKSDGMLDAFANDEEPFETEDFEDDFQALSNIDQRIYMPFRAGGFYRYEGVPMIDIIGHGGLTFADPFRMDLGAMVEGSAFPLSILSLGMGYEDLAWRTQLGLRLNLRFVELGLKIGTSSPEFTGMFSTRGLSANLMMAFGL